MWVCVLMCVRPSCVSVGSVQMYRRVGVHQCVCVCVPPGMCVWVRTSVQRFPKNRPICGLRTGVGGPSFVRGTSGRTRGSVRLGNSSSPAAVV